MATDKTDVRDFWDASSCGETYAVGDELHLMLQSQARERYRLEPYLEEFARFDEVCNQDALEIGVGMGADHVRLAQARPRMLAGVDLTPRAVEWTRTRMDAYGLQSQLHIADAENLPFDEASFSFVYSWGVLHHSPDTEAAVSEVLRVLKPGGRARIMIYHYHSIVGYLLWARYALMRGKPRRSLREIYAAHLESPGTKAFTVDEARDLFRGFSSVTTQVQLSFGDLLDGAVGQQHGGTLLRLAKRTWPRRLIRRYFSNHGLYLLVEATK